MRENELIGGYCFKHKDSLTPIELVENKHSCSEFDPKHNEVSKYCINCKRFAFVKVLSNNDGIFTPHKMHAIIGHPICTSVFDEHNRDFWPDVPEEDRIYSKSGKTWCRKGKR